MEEPEVGVVSSEILTPSSTEKLEENPNNNILSKSITIPSDLSNYFDPVQEGTEDYEPEQIKFKCSLKNCGLIVLYNDQSGWQDLVIHLATSHPTLDENEDTDTKNVALNEFPESEIYLNPIYHLHSSETEEIPNVKPKLTIPLDLKKYFELVHEAKDKYGPNTFKCLIDNCGRTISIIRLKGWNNCRRHLKIHSIGTQMTLTSRAKPKSSVSTATVKKTVKKPIKSKPAVAILPDSTRTLRVTLDRLDPDPSKWPLSTNHSITMESNEQVHSPNDLHDLCFICGKSAEEQIILQQKQIKRQRHYSKGIMRLFKIEKSESNILDFMKKSKYCTECWNYMKRIGEIHKMIDKLENELQEWRSQFENLMKGNVENMLNSSGEQTENKGVEILRMLMEGTAEPNYANPEPQNILHSVPEHISVPMNFDDDLNSFQDLISYEEHEFSDVKNIVSVAGTVRLQNPEINAQVEVSDLNPKTSATKNKSVKKRSVKSAHPKSISGAGLKCDKCDAFNIVTKFTTRSALQSHMKQEDLHPWFTNGIYTCPICSKKLTITKTIKRHRKIHAQFDLTSNNCSICSLKCSTEEELSNHMILHKTDKPFHCVICQVILSSSVDLKKHMLANHTSAVGVANRIKCSFKGCDKTFKDAKVKYQHEAKVHRKTIGLKCPHDNCKVISNGKAQLELHLSSHSNEKNHICDICGAQLKYKKGLERHRKSHLVRQGNGKFDNECKICFKSFESIQSLRGHEEIHSGLKDKLCDICGKSFRAKNNLAQHYRTHFKDGYLASGSKKKDTSKMQASKGDQAPPHNMDSVSVVVDDEDVANEYIIGDVYSLPPHHSISSSSDDNECETINVSQLF